MRDFWSVAFYKLQFALSKKMKSNKYTRWVHVFVILFFAAIGIFGESLFSIFSCGAVFILSAFYGLLNSKLKASSILTNSWLFAVNIFVLTSQSIDASLFSIEWYERGQIIVTALAASSGFVVGDGLAWSAHIFHRRFGKQSHMRSEEMTQRSKLDLQAE